MLESIVRYMGIEVDDALEIAEQAEIRCSKALLCRALTGHFLTEASQTIYPVTQRVLTLRPAVFPADAALSYGFMIDNF